MQLPSQRKRTTLYMNYLRYINEKAKNEPKGIEEVFPEGRDQDEKNQRFAPPDERRNPTVDG